MSGLLRALVLTLLAVTGCGGGSPAGPSALPAPPGATLTIPEGGYHAANPWSGDHLGELPGSWRMAHVMLDGHDTDVGRYFRTGRQIIVGAHNWGFRSEARPPWQKRGAPRWFLRQDFGDSYARLEALLRPHRGSIYAIEVADEPTSRSTPMDHVQTAVEWWESRGYPTLVNQQIKHAGAKPVNVSHYALTCYTQDKATGCWGVDWAACRGAYEATGADVVLGLGFDAPGCAITQGDLDQSRALAREVQAEALIWFLWPSMPGLQGLDSTDLQVSA